MVREAKARIRSSIYTLVRGNSAQLMAFVRIYGISILGTSNALRRFRPKAPENRGRDHPGVPNKFGAKVYQRSVVAQAPTQPSVNGQAKYDWRGQGRLESNRKFRGEQL
jgi:hypothetical protein